MEFRHAAVEVDTGIGVCGGIDALLLIEMVCLPVGELCRLGEALAEEVGPEFLQAEIFDAHAGGEVLEIDVACGVEALVAVGKHAPVVME